MARVPVYLEVKNDTTGAPVVGATATVKKRSDGTNATLYVAEVGATTTANPITTDARGRATAWADPDLYNILVAGTGVTSYTVPYDGAPPPVPGSVTTAALAAGAVDSSKIALLEKQQLGLNDGSQVGRGSFLQATAGTRTSTAFGALTNGPDKVSGLVLPTAGIIAYTYQALWQESVQGAANAIVLLGGNIVKSPTFQTGSSGPTSGTPLIGIGTGITAGFNQYLVSATAGGGLISNSSQFTGTNAGPDALAMTIGGSYGAATTPNIYLPQGGVVYIYAAAGTYDLEVQFKASSGTVTASSRRLYAWVVAF